MSKKSKSLVEDEQITGLKQDELYKRRITDVSRRFKSYQIKAAIKVNDEMLRFYWSIGRDISHMSQQYGYGSGFYKQISADLSRMLPDVKSFSATNLRYMVWFYELYQNLPQVGVNSKQDRTLPQLGVKSDEIQNNGIFLIPWGHQKLIIDKCKGNRDKALFYVHKTLENSWSRAVLLNFLDTDLLLG